MSTLIKSTLSPLQMFAEAKQLPILELVANGVRQPYCRLTFDYGDEFRTRIRTRDGFRWDRKTADRRIGPYGVWRLPRARRSGYLVIVEGESDALTGWHHGLSCLALPGCSMAVKLEAAHVEGIRTIYVWIEPGKGGKTFAKDVPRRLREVGFSGAIRIIAAPRGIKDLSELHCDDPSRFNDRLRKLLVAAPEAPEPTTPAPAPVVKPSSGHRHAPIGLDIDQIDLHALICDDLGPADRQGKWCCPFHDDHKPSLGLYTSKRDGRRRYKCHACGAGGDAADWMEKHRGFSRREALEVFRVKTRGFESNVRLNSSANGTIDKSDISFHSQVGYTHCDDPVPGYFIGKCPHNSHVHQAGVHRCGKKHCLGCNNYWTKQQLSRFVEAEGSVGVTGPALIEHYCRFGGSFYCAEIDRDQLDTVTRGIRREAGREGVQEESVNYLWIEQANDPKKVTMISTVRTKHIANEVTLSEAIQTVGTLILAITPEMRGQGKRHKTYGNSEGWTRTKEQQFSLYARPTGEQLKTIRAEVNRLEAEGEVSNVRDYLMDRQFRMTRFSVSSEFDVDAFLAGCGVVPLKAAREAEWGPPEREECEHEWMDTEGKHGPKQECRKCGTFYGYYETAVSKPDPQPSSGLLW